MRENMTRRQEIACHAIVHGASTVAGLIGAGLAQLPMSDRFAIAPFQIAMGIALGKVFGLTLGAAQVEAFLVPAVGSEIGRGVSQVLVGWIPVAGNVINAATAATLTEGLGWMLATQFAAMPERSAAKQ